MISLTRNHLILTEKSSNMLRMSATDYSNHPSRFFQKNEHQTRTV